MFSKVCERCARCFLFRRVDLVFYNRRLSQSRVVCKRAFILRKNAILVAQRVGLETESD